MVQFPVLLEGALVDAACHGRAIAQGQDGERIKQRHRAGGKGTADAHAPRCSIGLAAHDGHVAAEVDQRVFHAAFAQQREDAVGDVAFRDAAQIDAGQRVAQRHDGIVHDDAAIIHVPQRRGHVIARGNHAILEVPQLRGASHSHVE